jgi:hypothetical protein
MNAYKYSADESDIKLAFITEKKILKSLFRIKEREFLSKIFHTFLNDFIV